MTAEYKIQGLSKPNSVTLHHNGICFWAKTNFSREKFEELFNYSKDNWKDEPKYAILEFESRSEDGTPINAVVTGVSTIPFLTRTDKNDKSNR